MGRDSNVGHQGYVEWLQKLVNYCMKKKKNCAHEISKVKTFFYENIMILRGKSRNQSQIQVKDLFFREYLDFGTKSRKSETEFK